ncbi:uncharacterized protein UTRI_01537 [Ustilago trichophora]|uniref:3'-5' exonuclease n=1 Tax=Ustilago trichophora TaxID=86804 RepID=A0A5C3E0F4_9BASI|nr:uncharacterized protein UTRI_01537 [Ustilago trichophora]
MNSAACLLRRRHRHVPTSRHAFSNLVQHRITSTLNQTRCNYHGKSYAGSELKWDAEILDAMRSSSRKPRTNRPPKTWASTHHATKWDSSASTSASGSSKYKAFIPRLTAAQKEKEARLQELERGLEFYTHKTPAGPPFVAGTRFLAPLGKPSPSSVTLDSTPQPNGIETGNGKGSLKPPMVAYTADYDEANDLLSCLGSGPMGLDLEWNFSRFTGPNRTALLQICSSSLILIIHMSAMSHRVPPRLTCILQDPNIIKTGVAIKNDALKLQRDYGIHTRNIVELSNLAKLAQPELWAQVHHLISLRDLTRIYLGKRLKKDSVRVSDWETYPLGEGQIEYAASDTFVSLEILRAISAYFRPESKDAGKGLLAQLDRMSEEGGMMDLDQALKLSAYDLYQERTQLGAAKKQEQRLRVALRDIQPPAKDATAPQDAFLKKPTNAATTTTTTSSSSSSSDDELVTVTKVLLAHDRAMNRWLYASQTITQVALASKIKIDTVASYLVKALLFAQANASRPGAEAGLLDDFTAHDRVRLDNELNEAGGQAHISLKRYRVLAKKLGWTEVVARKRGSTSASRSASGSRSESGSEGEASPNPSQKVPSQKKRASSPQQKKAPPPPKKKACSPPVVEVSDDEVDVVDRSRPNYHHHPL